MTFLPIYQSIYMHTNIHDCMDTIGGNKLYRIHIQYIFILAFTLLSHCVFLFFYASRVPTLRKSE